MLVHELSRAECADVLGRATVGRIACVRDAHPYVVPVHIAFDGHSLYGFATLGQKIEWMRVNPLVCVEVEEIEGSRHWTTVLAFGRYEELSKATEHQAARDRAVALLTPRGAFWLPGAARFTGHEHGTPILYRIAVDRMTGRRATTSE